MSKTETKTPSSAAPIAEAKGPTTETRIVPAHAVNNPPQAAELSSEPAYGDDNSDGDEVLSGNEPFYESGDGVIDWECSVCDVLFALGMTEGELRDVVFHCTNCGAHSITPDPESAA